MRTKKIGSEIPYQSNQIFSKNKFIKFWAYTTSYAGKLFNIDNDIVAGVISILIHWSTSKLLLFSLSHQQSSNMDFIQNAKCLAVFLKLKWKYLFSKLDMSIEKFRTNYLVITNWTWNVQTKGQIISKCLFGVFNFLQQTNENKLTWGFIVVK